MTRRTAAFTAAAVLFAVLLFMAVLVPVPYVALSPGPTFNTIGSFAGKPLITIKETTTYPVSGNLDMVTVSETGGAYGGLTFGQALVSMFRSGSVVLPRALLFPDNQSSQQVQQQGQEEFTASQADATAAALNYLKIPVTQHVYIDSVITGSPADGKLKPADYILAVDGTKVTDADQVGKIIKAKPAGTKVRFDVQRQGKDVSVDVTVAPNPKDPKRSYVGILVGTTYTGPFPITFQLSDVGGPSAGMMFALGIVDLLTPGWLNGGKFIAGTGTIAPDGTVGPIGGIDQKLVAARDSGAKFFLAPKDNCSDIGGKVPAGLTVASVTTLQSAIDAINAWLAGKPVPSCPK